MKDRTQISTKRFLVPLMIVIIWFFSSIEQFQIVSNGGTSVDASKKWIAGKSWEEWNSEVYFDSITMTNSYVQISWIFLSWLSSYILGSYVIARAKNFQLFIRENLSGRYVHFSLLVVSLFSGYLILSSITAAFSHHLSYENVMKFKVVCNVFLALFGGVTYLRRFLQSCGEQKSVEKFKSRKAFLSFFIALTVSIVWQIQIGRNFMIGDSVIPFVETLMKYQLINEPLDFIPKQSDEISFALFTINPWEMKGLIISFWINAAIFRVLAWCIFIILMTSVLNYVSSNQTLEDKASYRKFRRKIYDENFRISFSVACFLNILVISPIPFLYPGELIGGNFPYLLSPLPGRQLFPALFVLGITTFLFWSKISKGKWLLFFISLALCQFSYSNFASFVGGLLVGIMLKVSIFESTSFTNLESSRDYLVREENKLSRMEYVIVFFAWTTFFVHFIFRPSQNFQGDTNSGFLLVLISLGLFSLTFLSVIKTILKELFHKYLEVFKIIGAVTIGVILGTILYGNLLLTSLSQKFPFKWWSQNIDMNDSYYYFTDALRNRNFGSLSYCPGSPRTSQCLGLDGFLSTHGLAIAGLLFLFVTFRQSRFVVRITATVGIFYCISTLLVDYGGWNLDELGEHAITLFWVDSRFYEITFALVPILLFIGLTYIARLKEQNTRQATNLILYLSVLSAFYNSYGEQVWENTRFLLYKIGGS